MKKLLIFGIVIVLISFNFLPNSIGVSKELSDIIYVDDDGDADYTRIQDAIDNASDGDFIFVYNGIYYERVEVDKSLTLIGEDMNQTIINKRGFDVEADNVSISGFTIQNDFVGIGIISSNFVNVYGNKIINQEFKALSLVESSNVHIEGNIINNSYDWGIRIGYSTNISIIGNTITNTGNYSSISITNSNNILIGGNTIYNSNRGVGIYIETSFNNIIKDNNVRNNYGNIQLCESHDNTIEGNFISDAIYDGIVLHHSTTSTNIKNNHISDNNRYGLYIESTSGNSVTSNNFIGNERNAFINVNGNLWDGNYWNRPRLFPKFIFGIEGFHLFVDIDWHPSIKVNDCGLFF